jgi:large subunit ribosomal protein L35
MPKMKTRKNLAKKVKVTGTGKIIRRSTGQNHFNAKCSGSQTRAKRSDKRVTPKNEKSIKRTLGV